MRNLKTQVIIAIVVGIVLILGVISCFFIQDPTTFVMLIILAILYFVYVAALLRKTKKLRESKEKPVDSPLARRR